MLPGNPTGQLCPVAVPVALPLEGTQSLRAKGQGNRERRCFTQSATHRDRAPVQFDNGPSAAVVSLLGASQRPCLLAVTSH